MNSKDVNFPFYQNWFTNECAIKNLAKVSKSCNLLFLYIEELAFLIIVLL